MRWEDEDDDFPHRPRSRFPRFGFPYFGRFFEDFEREMEHMFREMTKDMPKDLVTERKLPDGTTVSQYGPFIYGYSMSVGPDGKPVVREFGNVKPSMRPGAFGMPLPSIEPTETREPLVDTFIEGDHVKVVAELPGVEKPDITLESTEDSLTLRVDKPQRKYYKEVDLPAKVDPNTANASYNNGVLEVTLKQFKPTRSKGKEIKIQ